MEQVSWYTFPNDGCLEMTLAFFFFSSVQIWSLEIMPEFPKRREASRSGLQSQGKHVLVKHLLCPTLPWGQVLHFVDQSSSLDLMPRRDIPFSFPRQQRLVIFSLMPGRLWMIYIIWMHTSYFWCMSTQNDTLWQKPLLKLDNLTPQLYCV